MFLFSRMDQEGRGEKVTGLEEAKLDSETLLGVPQGRFRKLVEAVESHPIIGGISDRWNLAADRFVGFVVNVWNAVSRRNRPEVRSGLLAKARRGAFNFGQSASRRYASLNWAHVAIATVLSLAIIATVDWATGHVVAFRLNYVIPIWLAARLGGFGAGFLATLLVGALMSLSDGQFATGSPNEQVVNFAIRWISLFGFLLTVVHVEGALKIARQRAARDPLTGLANRGTIEALANEVFERSDPATSQIHIAVIDCDRFKELNDLNGHAFGDHALRVLARRLEWATREQGSVARLGGDEFVVIFEGVELSEVERALEKANAGFKKMLGCLNCRAAISFGTATFGRDGERFDTLCRVADERMFERKRTKASGVAVVQPPSKTRKRASWLS
jgi:diguanylate cyclase (GGDEF)-like protein